MNRSSTWSPLRVLIILLIKCGVSRPMMAIEEPIYPKFAVIANHTALSGDLRVSILVPPVATQKHTTTVTPVGNDPDSTAGTRTATETQESRDTRKLLVLRVLLLDGFSSEVVGEVPLENPPSNGGNVTVIIPCGFFSRGGSYTLQLQYKFSSTATKLSDKSELPEVQVSSALDVKWPTPSLNVEPQEFYTYPSETVLATLVYNAIKCVPAKNVPVPEYILQLIYCGSSVVSCDPQNKNRAQVLYFEEVKGFPSSELKIILRCEFFGLAGNYALRLKPTEANSNAPTTSVYIKVDWSDKFIFNIHARSVYPCEGSGGVSVLFEYPSCRLQGDRVRVYGRLRANVASLAPPSTLHYVAELKAAPGKHSLTFDCDIFTEKFIEYCFAYVSQAITGAMAEVKLDCIPTFPLQEGDGGWGPWSPWTPCSSSCVGGTRNRYRFCDTPPPRYGAKFCEGKAVETESCGGSSHLDLQATWNNADWECRHGGELAATRPEVTAEVGTKCRCGCVINLQEENSRRILAASTQACPGRSFWLLQARPNFVVRLHLDQAQFSCPGQYFRARDGDSLNADLLIDIAFDKAVQNSGTVFSTEESLLLEFFSDEITAAGESCISGFLAHATTLHKSLIQNGTLLEAHLESNSTATAKKWIFWLTPAHLAAASLLTLIFLISLFLALQYAFRYRKYHIAEDLDNLSENSAYSESIKGIVRRPRAMSSATLISEVVSLVRLHRNTPKHAKLKATPGDVEDGYESSETQADFEDDASIGSITIKAKEDENTSQKTIIPSVLDSNDKLSMVGVPSQPEVKYARPVKLRTLDPSTSVQEEDQTLDSCQDSVNLTPNASAMRSRQNKTNSVESQESSTTSAASSNTSTLRSGKESKDRRNREKLMQGPGSEFSLSNPEVDLELDYYDYNVANASAVPGSYLGMDPAFLVWIPPFLSGEDIDEMKTQEKLLETSEIETRLGFDLEGATLTPSEYKRMRQNRIEDSNSLQKTEDIRKRPDSGDSGENTSSDETGEGKVKLSDRLLPIHRILEDSRIRVSEESLSSHLKDKLVQQNVIPNRLHENLKLEVDYSTDKICTKKNEEKGKSKSSNSKKNSQEDQWGSKKQLNQKTKNAQDERRNKRGETSSSRILDKHVEPRSDDEDSKTFLANLNLMNNQSKFRGSPSLSENRKLDAVNIPMMDLSSKIKSPKMTERKAILSDDIQSPDYGVEVDSKDESRDSFYDLIRESEDKIRFADDDEELCDNKINI